MITRIIAVKNAASTAMPYSTMLLNAGMVSNDVNTKRAGLPAAEADDQTADQTADEHSWIDSLEPQVNTVERRFGDAAQQTRRQRARRGLPHLDVTLPPGQEQHAGGGAKAGEVPGAHRALDEVVAQRLDVDQHDRVDRPVQTQRHHERVGQRDDDGEDQR